MLYRQLEYFCIVAETENFTEAAEKLFISQPALSRSIANLENDLGVPLFDRKGRSVQLNRYGRFFLEKVHSSLSLIKEGKRQLQEMVDPLCGTVRLSFIHTLGNSLIPELIHNYKKFYPSVDIMLFQETTNVLMDQLNSGEIDLCFIMDADFPPEIHYEPIFEEELFVIVPKTHHLANEKEIDLKQIANEPFIGFKKGVGLRAVTDKYCKEAGFTPNLTFESQQVGTISGLVSVGLGVSLVPKNRGMEQYEVVLLPVANTKCTRVINIAWKKDIYVPEVVKLFKKFVYEEVKTYS